MTRGLRHPAAMAALVIALVARAEAPTVPFPLQAVLIKKVLSYHPSAPRLVDVRVLVVYDRESSEEVTAVLDTFRAIGLQSSAEKIDHLAEKPDAFVLYGLPTVPWPRLQARANASQRFTVASVPGPVRSGQAALSFDRRADGKIELLVNWAELKAEGQELSSELLKLCVVIR